MRRSQVKPSGTLKTAEVFLSVEHVRHERCEKGKAAISTAWSFYLPPPLQRQTTTTNKQTNPLHLCFLKNQHQPCHSQEWTISNFFCSLTRNITSHSMKNLAFHSLLIWEDGYTTYSSLPHLSICLQRVGRMYFLNLGVKGLNRDVLTDQKPLNESNSCPVQPFSNPAESDSSKPDQANPGLTEFFLSTFWPPNRTRLQTQPEGLSRLKACRGRRILG